MPDQNLDFSFNLTGVNREALLREAGMLIDAGRSHLSGGSSTAPATTEGDLVRDLMEDQATLAAAPDVYRITDQDFLDRQRPVPVRFQELSRQFRFYWLRLPVGLMPRRNWAFNRLEVKIEFNPGGAPNTRPKGYQILPDKKFQDLLQVTDRLEVSLDSKFEFSARVAGGVEGATGEVKAGASAAGGGGGGFKLVAGPFEYRFTKARIDHSGTGVEWVFWRIDGAEFFRENRPELVVIVQVPEEAKTFTVRAAMQAYRYFSTGGAEWQEAILGLPARLIGFFKNGAPLGDTKEYDLSDSLRD